ncbi:hypothetical protein LX36DRAFT_649995 [Colletotrichum falcatum]|nr:hypothetical protein LX36DRAFT_649995 [Colletotrichum falcatum]
MSSRPENSEQGADAERSQSPARSRRRLDGPPSNDSRSHQSPHALPRRPKPRDASYHPPVNYMEPAPATSLRVGSLEFSGSSTGTRTSHIFEFGSQRRHELSVDAVPDPLLHAILCFIDERTPSPAGQSAKKHQDIIQKILVSEFERGFRRYGHRKHRLAVEFSWNELVSPVKTYCPGYNTSRNVLFTELYYDKKLLGSGTIGNEGEFSVAVGQMLKLARKQVEQEQDSDKVEVHFAVRRGRAATDVYEYFTHFIPSPNMAGNAGSSAAAREKQDQPMDEDPAGCHGGRY